MSAGDTIKILLVEDNPGDSLIIREMLKKLYTLNLN